MPLCNFIQYAKRHTKKSFLVISIILLSLDMSFVVINYFYSKKALCKNLATSALTHQNEFGITLEMTYSNMMQMAEFIGNDHYLNQIFLEGKKALQKPGATDKSPAVQKARQELLARVKPAWDKLTDKFNVRQLHYHLGPGSTSFLRVHRPDKYGDNMDNIRHTVVDTNAQQTARTGYETGRIYGGIRAVSPISAPDPTTGEFLHVGALEVGTSFDMILPIFRRYYSVDSAVFLTKEHVEERMWPEFVQKIFGSNTQKKFYLESSSRPDVEGKIWDLLGRIKTNPDFVTTQIQLIKLADQDMSVYYFPLRDYQGEKDPSLPPAGLVLLWEDVSSAVQAFRHSLWVNIIYALAGFLLIEVLLVVALNRELRLATAEQKAIYDGLTGFYNRHYFDEELDREISNANRSKCEVSILVCDIDQFKKYNDFYGHQKGDECLKKLAECLQMNLNRKIDWIARYGGEEFVVVLPCTKIENATIVADRLRHAVEELKIPHAETAMNRIVTFSIGVASSAEVDSGSSLFECADMKLYRAKNSGRNKVEA